jgi:murein L,D-transpeptidase YcbB/YkuD
MDVVAYLQQALHEQTLAASLHRLVPSEGGYLRLREALRRYRHIASRGGWRKIASGQLLRLGDRSERVADLRFRLWVTHDLKSSRSLKVGEAGSLSQEADKVFDAEVEQAVQSFQRRHGLEVDGIVGPNTLEALNVTVDDRIRQLGLNLERWRQRGPDFGERYLYVNIPDYTLHVVEDGRSTMTMRVIVGKPQWRTPTFRSAMTHLVLNPYWVVPQRIGREEIIPRVQENPEYLDTQQMELIEGWGATARVVDPSIIDWTAVSEKKFPYRFRQQPGRWNALGRVKFKFSNPYSIYIHDTPARSLFAKPQRAFSHGCVRLEHPLELATFLLRETSWTPERIGQMLDRGQQSYVNLPRPIDVHIVYHTAWMDESGVIHFRPDIYGHDQSQQNVLCRLSKYECV